MRKRNVNHIADTIIWTLIYIAPLLMAFLVCTTDGTTFNTAIVEVFRLFTIDANNPILLALIDIFGAPGILPTFANNSIVVQYLTYFIMSNIIHIFVDVILLLPRLCHHLGDKLERGGIHE